MKRLGVLGWPVGAQPLAGDAQRRARGARPRATGTTSACRSRPRSSTRRSRAARRAGFVGANVTIPHKEAALALADEATAAARAIGAANTLTFDADGGGDPRREHRRARASWPRCAARRPTRRADRARARRRRQRPRRRLRAARGGRGARRGLEPDRRARRDARRRPRGRRRRSADRRGSSGQLHECRAGRRASSRNCRSTPMRWAHTRPWRTWSTGPAAPGSSRKRDAGDARWSTASRSSSARAR